MKLEEIGVLAERMKTGLDKLVEAEKSVNALSVELAVKEKDLAVASKEADEVRSNMVELFGRKLFGDHQRYSNHILAESLDLSFAFCAKFPILLVKNFS